MPAALTIDGSFDQRKASGLDDVGSYQRLDPDDMRGAIASFPDQLRAATELVGQVDWLSYKPTTPAGVCVCGMGGSAIGGDLVRSYWEYESPVPMVVVRSDLLPEYINRFWMVIASSYSGDTQESLSAVEEARRRGCHILAITSGGRLAQSARDHRWPLILLPGGMMPRAALGYSFGPVLLSLSRWGIVPDRGASLLTAADQLGSRCGEFAIDRPAASNAAKQAGALLAGRTICVYGTTGYTDVVALRYKCQLSENSKAVAFANSVPELLHNEIVGLDANADPEQFAVIIIRSGEEPNAARRRLDWLTQRVRKRGTPVVTIQSEGVDRLARLLVLVQTGDFISYYTAIAGGQDPTPIPAIGALKAELP